MSRLVSVGTKVEQIEGLLGTADLNAWEQQFVTDIVRRFKALPDADRAKFAGHYLTAKQIDAVDRIWGKHFT